MCKATIIEQSDTYRYFDKNGTELKDGDLIQYDSGRRERLYLTTNGSLARMPRIHLGSSPVARCPVNTAFTRWSTAK